MDIFLIDFENVKSEGLNGILNLAKTDLVCVFWSLKEDKLKIETTEQLMKCQVPVYFYKADVGGKNALDHQLSSYLGYLIGKGTEDAHYYIISNDKGYRFLADFWKRMKVDAPIELAPSIKAVKTRQQQQQRQQAFFNEPRVERIAQKESPKLLPVKETPVEEPLNIPEEIPAPVAEETVIQENANVPAEVAEERPANTRKKRRGHRSRRRPKPVTDAAQDLVEAPAEETAEIPAEELPDAEVVLEIPSEGIIAEVTMEEAPVEELATEISLGEPAEVISEEAEELPDAEVVLEIPSEGIVAEVTLEETPAEEAPAQETPEEKAPKKSRSRSSRNRRSRAKKQEAEVKEEVIEVPAEEPTAEGTPAEPPVEVTVEAPAVQEAEPANVEPTQEIPVEAVNAEPAQEAIEAPAKKPAKRSRRKPAKKQNAESPAAEVPAEPVGEETQVASPVEAPAAEVPAEKPAKAQNKSPEKKTKDIPSEKAAISMDALTALIPDSKEEPWVPALLDDINASRNKKELYAKVIRRLKQENGREIYHKIKKLVP